MASVRFDEVRVNKLTALASAEAESEATCIYFFFGFQNDIHPLKQEKKWVGKFVYPPNACP